MEEEIDQINDAFHLMFPQIKNSSQQEYEEFIRVIESLRNLENGQICVMGIVYEFDLNEHLDVSMKRNIYQEEHKN